MKADYNTKIAELEKKILDNHNNKCITIQEFNKLTAEHFTATLKQANLAIRADTDDLVEKAETDGKLKHFNKKVTSNKIKHVETEKKLTDLKNMLSDKGYEFLWSRMYFTSDDSYQNFFVFAPILSWLILGNNKKFANLISIKISSEKIKPFDTSFETTMFNLANGRVILKFNNFLLL